MFGCKHKWSEVSRVYNGPSPYDFTYSKATPMMVNRALHGFTNIELRCDDCKDIKVISDLGKIGNV